MNNFRIALANLRFPSTPAESVALAEAAIAQAAAAGAALICFPECYVPGYRGLGHEVEPPNAQFLEQAWSSIARAAAEAKTTVVLGTERLVGDSLLASVLVISENGTLSGFQDKVQLDPSEDGTYTPGAARCADRFSSAPRSKRARRIPGHHLCRSGKHFSRESSALPRGGKHLLLCHGELRSAVFVHHLGGSAS
jgi:predicted amidohydrolase